MFSCYQFSFFYVATDVCRHLYIENITKQKKYLQHNRLAFLFVHYVFDHCLSRGW